MTIGAGLLCAANNDIAVLNYLILTRNQVANTPHAKGVVSVDIAGAESTIHPTNTSLATNPLAFMVPSGPTLAPHYILLRVSIHRDTATTARIIVNITDDFQSAANAFLSTLGAVAFASSLTIDLNIDFFKNPGDSDIRVQLINAWIEKYKAS
jgi:hypothetical protein